jgi:hypothetical protein
MKEFKVSLNICVNTQRQAHKVMPCGPISEKITSKRKGENP